VIGQAQAASKLTSLNLLQLRAGVMAAIN